MEADISQMSRRTDRSPERTCQPDDLVSLRLTPFILVPCCWKSDRFLHDPGCGPRASTPHLHPQVLVPRSNWTGIHNGNAWANILQVLLSVETFANGIAVASVSLLVP